MKKESHIEIYILDDLSNIFLQFIYNPHIMPMGKIILLNILIELRKLILFKESSLQKCK